MNILLPIGILVLASAFGFWHKSKQGKAKASVNQGKLVLAEEIGAELGSRATLLQFSTAFCAPCKATSQIISNTVKDMNDVQYVQISSEYNLHLVEKFDIKSTPTVLVINSDGVEVGRATGTPTKQQVLDSLQLL